jgi:DNA-binding MarR family transcriptional regulator
MNGRPATEIHQRRPPERAEEAFLDLLRTAAVLERALARRFRPVGITWTQYDALRTLRGSHPEALACSEVGERMVTAVPDVTRLLDRLEGRGWVERRRAAEDRRVVLVAITGAGLGLLERLDPQVARWIERRFMPLSRRAVDALADTLETLRREATEDDDE